MSKKLPTRQEDYSLWYNELVKRAGLAENSAVRGCMVIKPYGYAIWEKMQRQLDDMFKRTGHENAYFPLFVPKSLFEAEEKNAEGFAKECAVVTHYRLQTDPDKPGKLRVDPNAKLEEELVVRPTSEAIIWSTYKNWVQSYRDLPLLINQWATWCAGKCAPDCFCAPPSSCGRKATRPTPPPRRPWPKPARCSTCTLSLPKSTWPCPW